MGPLKSEGSCCTSAVISQPCNGSGATSCQALRDNEYNNKAFKYPCSSNRYRSCNKETSIKRTTRHRVRWNKSYKSKGSRNLKVMLRGRENYYNVCRLQRQGEWGRVSPSRRENNQSSTKGIRAPQLRGRVNASRSS